MTCSACHLCAKKRAPIRQSPRRRAIATTNANGAYTFSGTLNPGTYYFRTYYAGSSQYRKAFSPSVKVSITRQAMTLNLKTLNSGTAYTFYGALGIGSGQTPRIAGARVLVHNVNLGKGAALRDLFQYPTQYGFDIIVVIDGGQHNPDDIPKLVEPLVRDEADVVN